MDNQQPSTSSSSSRPQEEMAKIENQQVEKKMKEESKSEHQIQVEVESKCFINELPPEMLMKILSCLDVKSIALSRLVNRRWNDFAREILKSRDDVKVFSCNRTEDGNFRIQGGSHRASLENFNECFEASKESPLYTRFRFDRIKFSVFDHAAWIKFISQFGKSVKSLKLVIHECERDINMMSFAEKLRDLLMIQLPNLQEFGFLFAFSHLYVNDPALSNIRLFPTTSEVRLPHLKTLYLVGDSFLKKTGLVTDLLRAAVNLQSIESFYYSLDLFKTFQLLHSLGKLQCLQKAMIKLTPGLLSQVKEGSMDISLFKLKKLDLFVSPQDIQIASRPDASNFLSSLFESNKDSLTELKIEPLGFLPQLQLPKFSKLTNLAITSPRGYDQRIQVLPSGINLEEIFPALQHLDLQVTWTQVFPHNEKVSCIPTLKTLIVTQQEMMGEIITRISQVCPNLKELKLATWKSENFPLVGPAIWTHLTKLESLDVRIAVYDPANSLADLESCFTGFSKVDCIRLHNLIKDENSTKKRGPKSELEAERENPSILDLKNLRNLKVSLILRNWDNGGSADSTLYIITLAVIEKYALKLMENLTYKIE